MSSDKTEFNGIICLLFATSSFLSSHTSTYAGTSCSMSGGDSCRAINNRYCGGFLNGGKGVSQEKKKKGKTLKYTPLISFALPVRQQIGVNLPVCGISVQRNMRVCSCLIFFHECPPPRRLHGALHRGDLLQRHIRRGDCKGDRKHQALQRYG